jgi:NAD(P)-dependent dehydrogenase (short-subunit alcohol dehydrogenase family)
MLATQDCLYLQYKTLAISKILFMLSVDYTSTKGAIVSFTRALSNQIVGKKHIRVNGMYSSLLVVLHARFLTKPSNVLAVAPGPIWTPLVSSTFNEEKLGSFGSVPIGRPGQPIEVATCVIFL